MPGKVNLTLPDYEGKVGTVSVFVPLYTAGTFTAQQGLVDALVAAIDAVTLAPIKNDSRLLQDIGFAVANPSDVNAQRGTKWLVRMVEAVSGNSVIFRIPAADLSLLSAGSANMNISSGAGAALVAAIEAIVVSNDGTGVTVTEIVHLD